MKGYIKDYRKELQSDIWMMPPLYHRVWQYLKYKVNHNPAKIPMEDGNFFTINPGQHLSSVRGIAEGVGYYEGLKWKSPNPKTISTILSWLEKQGMITIDRGRGNRQYTLITLLNWEEHQSKTEEGNKKETGSGEGKKQLADINKNDKECLKNDKEKDNTVSIIFDHYISKNIINHQKITSAMRRAINARLKDYDLDQIKKAIDNYSQVLKGDEFYFSHKYPLADFMRDKDIRKFIDEADPLNNFLKNKDTKAPFQVVKGGRNDENRQSSYQQDYSQYDFSKKREL
jgi:predicted transcriptional regulator